MIKLACGLGNRSTSGERAYPWGVKGTNGFVMHKYYGPPLIKNMLFDINYKSNSEDKTNKTKRVKANFRKVVTIFKLSLTMDQFSIILFKNLKRYNEKCKYESSAKIILAKVRRKSANESKSRSCKR